MMVGGAEGGSRLKENWVSLTVRVGYRGRFGATGQLTTRCPESAQYLQRPRSSRRCLSSEVSGSRRIRGNGPVWFKDMGTVPSAVNWGIPRFGLAGVPGLGVREGVGGKMWREEDRDG